MTSESEKNAEMGAPSLPPVALILANLTVRWDDEEASVAADWCEGHGMYGAAGELRKGPSAECRAMCHALAACFGRAKAIQRGDWPQNWPIEWLREHPSGCRCTSCWRGEEAERVAYRTAPSAATEEILFPNRTIQPGDTTTITIGIRRACVLRRLWWAQPIGVRLMIERLVVGGEVIIGDTTPADYVLKRNFSKQLSAGQIIALTLRNIAREAVYFDGSYAVVLL